jgi:hypothetical protein
VIATSPGLNPDFGQSTLPVRPPETSSQVNRTLPAGIPNSKVRVTEHSTWAGRKQKFGRPKTPEPSL